MEALSGIGIYFGLLMYTKNLKSNTSDISQYQKSD